jgi:glycosyltransferase involved in cell wall biosynthesis
VKRLSFNLEKKMISVVMPAYNSAQFIPEAIESILNQSVRDFELLIVDDGSTDDTLSIASKYAEYDARVRLIQSGHGGASRARNTGIEHAQYDWIALMDADDVSLPDRLEKQLAAACSNSRVVAWGTYALLINSQGQRLGFSKTGPTTEVEFHELRSNNELATVITATALMKKAAFLQVGPYDPFFDPTEDLELFERLATVGPILAVPEPLYLRRIHKSNVTTHRFLLHRAQARYVKARQRARVLGTTLPTYQEFILASKSEPLLKRIRRQLDDLSQYNYRQSALEYSEGNYIRWLFKSAMSVFLYPKYALRRAWSQKLSREAQRWLVEKSCS